ncbi:NAD(P)H-hydrate dehydratase [uncultured Clostridium sp.]|uniref:NAD(P)H-hydrate dehydratase n=1 Tax=uncultured Clostridium sp. TaxID=59620 RepID=UPI002673EF14|nr:NAD(P)H-hydrate dehydratase [uncultured Clostridium sp.]
MYIMSKKNCSNIDKQTIDEYNMPGIILMENAAEQIFRNIRTLGNRYIIFCGNGNNGADGLAIGRKLIFDNKDVLFILLKPRKNPTEEFQVNFNILKSLKVNMMIIDDIDKLDEIQHLIEDFPIVIDSIFGIGLDRKLNDFYFKIIDIINNSNKKIIAVDVPSGLDADSGRPLGSAVKAHITYTVEVIKKGFIEYSALEYLGDLKVIQIGIPENVKQANNENIYALSRESYRNKLIKRKIYGHKGNYGRAVLVAGSIGCLGAARLATESCIRSGAGLTTLITSSEGRKLLSGSLVEGMLATFEDNEKVKYLLSKADAVAFGPGIKEDEESMKLLEEIIIDSPSSIIIDAGGINLLSKNKKCLCAVKDKVILTPHPGEMARLIGKDISYVEKNRIECSRAFAKQYKCIVLLKGYNTVVTDGKNVFINKTGNSKMASGGMGDTLTGIITALVAQGYSNMDATLLGAYIHGLAAEYSARDRYSIIARDLIESIPFVMGNL